MRILDREYLWLWLKPTLTSMIICLVLVMMTDVLGLTEDFMENLPTLGTVLRYVLYRTGYALFVLVPISALMGGFWGLCNWKRSNEWTASLTSGTHPLILLRAPLVALGLLTLVTMTYSVVYLPSITTSMKVLREQKIKGNKPPSDVFRNIHLVLRQGSTIQIGRFEPARGELRDVVVSNHSPTRILKRIHAERGQYHSDGRWVLKETRSYHFAPSGQVQRVETKESLPLSMEPPSILRKVLSANPRHLDKEPAQLTLEELQTAIEFRTRRNLSAAPERIYVHWKFGYPLSVFILGIIGMVVGSHSEMNHASGVGFCLVFGFVYLVIFSAFTSLGKSVSLTGPLAPVAPLLFVYTPQVVFLAAVLFYWLLLRDRFEISFFP